MKKLIYIGIMLFLIVVMFLFVPSVNGAGENLGSCDFSTKCINKSATAFIRTDYNNSNKFCIEYPDNGTMFCSGNTIAGAVFINLSINSSMNTNEILVTILNFSYQRESTSDIGTNLMVLSNKASQVDADEWLVLGNTFETAAFDALPSRTQLTGGTGASNFEGQVLKRAYHRWLISYNVTNGTAQYYNETTEGSGVWTFQHQNTATNVDKMVQAILLFGDRKGGDTMDSDTWFSNIQMINNSFNLSVSATGDTINPSANITNKNASDSLKFGNVLNISIFAQDETALTVGNITFNLTGNNDLYNFSFALSGTSAFFSQNITINLTRGNVINATVWVYDGTNYGQNSTLITVANTAPNGSNIANISGKHYNKNITINVTPSIDADADTLTYSWYINSSTNGNQVLVASGIGVTNWTTNVTSNNGYAVLVNVTDGTETATSNYWNFTLDTTIPTISNLNITNNTFLNKNLTIYYTANDADIFNATGNLSSATETLQFFYNDTRLGTSTLNIIQNLNITGLADGNYTWSLEAVDTNSEAIDTTTSTKGKKGEQEVIFTDTMMQKEISLKISFVEKLEKPTDLPSIKSFIDYDNRSFIIFGVNFTVIKPETKIVFNVTTTQGDIKILQNTNYLGHLLLVPYGMNFNGSLMVNGIKRDYTTSITRINNQEVLVQIIPTITLAGNDVVAYVSESLYGLNYVKTSYNQVKDTTNPIPHEFNISGLINNTFTKANYFNITINATEKYSDTALFYVNDIKNASVVLYNNKSLNITGFNISTDGNYTFKIELNDSAGNKINFSYFYNVIIDTTAPTDSNALNRTTLSNITDITPETDVNLTVYLGDIYLNKINISHNASGSWINHSFDGTGNGTYSLMIRKENLTAGEVVGWKYDAFDLAGNQLDPINTFTVGSSATSKPQSSGGGGTAPSFMTQTTLLNPFGEAPSNGICPETQQIFDNKCYACSSNGYLKFNTEDRSVLCIQCNNGYKLEGDKCVLLPAVSIKSQINGKIDSIASKISSLFGTQNLLIGYFILVSGVLTLAYYGWEYLERRPNGR